jgi:hypothetical protein
MDNVQKGSCNRMQDLPTSADFGLNSIKTLHQSQKKDVGLFLCMFPIKIGSKVSKCLEFIIKILFVCSKSLRTKRNYFDFHMDTFVTGFKVTNSIRMGEAVRIFQRF